MTFNKHITRLDTSEASAISLDDEENNGILRTLSSGDADNSKFTIVSGDDTMQTEEETNSRQSTISSCQSAVEEFFNQPTVEYTIISLIVINAIMLGIGTFDFITTNSQAQAAFDIIDLIFLVVFTIEVALRVFSKGKSFFCDFWLLFDLFLIATSWVGFTGIGLDFVALRGKYLQTLV